MGQFTFQWLAESPDLPPLDCQNARSAPISWGKLVMKLQQAWPLGMEVDILEPLFFGVLQLLRRNEQDKFTFSLGAISSLFVVPASAADLPLAKPPPSFVSMS